MRELSAEEIETFASRSGVRRIAVENFLGTMSCMDASAAMYNLQKDARDYGWNSATKRAILEGIQLASRPRNRSYGCTICQERHHEGDPLYRAHLDYQSKDGIAIGRERS